MSSTVNAPLDSADVGELYRMSRERLVGVLSTSDSDARDVPVQACPGWSVGDVIAHLVGVVEDAAAGRLNGPPPPVQTRRQVARHRNASLDELLSCWARLAPGFESAISSRRAVPAFLDVLSHEHDIRAALERPGARADHGVIFAAQRLSAVADVRVQIELVDGPSGDAAADHDGWILRASAFEVFRFRLGRRTRSEVRSLCWSADPEPVLETLFAFGPATETIGESTGVDALAS